MPTNGQIIWTCAWCNKRGTVDDVPIESTTEQRRANAALHHKDRSETCALVHGALGIHWTFSFDEVV